MNEQRKHKRLVAALSLAVILLMITVFMLGLTFFRLSRVNLFSKNIELSNTWMFERGETDGTANVEECPSFPAAEFSAEYAEMYNTLLDYEAELCQRQAEVNDTLNTMQAAFSSRLLDVPHLNQQEAALPNGCEAVCAVMLLQYNHFSVTAEEFVSAHLPCEPVELRWGCRYGPDPSVSYAGDPHSKRGGFGCFSPVIVKALQSYLPQSHRVVNLTGKTLQEIAVTYIAADIPVAVWVTQDMTPIEKAYQWQSYDKTESFLYPVNQHCMVFCGFDSKYYYFSDPLSEESLVKYPRATAEGIYRSMGQQAVAVFQSDANAP